MERQSGPSRSPDQKQSPPPKRARVSLACQRCKSRKQKCDGVQPSCAQCIRMEVECRYVSSLAPKPQDKKIYIAALEDRVAQLESYLSSMGQAGVGDDHWRQTQKLQIAQPDEVESLLNTIQDLSLSASGHYIGGTSTITLGRLLGAVISSQKDTIRPEARQPESFKEQNPNPRTISSETLAEMMGPMFVSQGVANRLLEGFLKHIATRFPVVHTPWIRDLHENRDFLNDAYDESILHLVYATGGRFLETTGETGNFFSDQHYEAVLPHMNYILDLRDSRSIGYLLLLAIYCLRSPRDPGAWNFARLAMTACIDLGLHRRSTNHRPLSVKSELEKRIFWSCYYLDREISVALGRPPAISDGDIDVELPLDVDEDATDPDILAQASRNNSRYPSNPANSLTSFIHNVRLKRIESEIQSTIYRVSSPTPVNPSIIQEFLDRLSAWENMLPTESQRVEDKELQPYDGIEVYLVAYHKVVRLLLYPSLSTTPLNTHYLHLCAIACSSVCQTYKKLHHKMNFGPSPLSLQSVFLAGLTLLYCAWLSPHPPTFPLTGPLTDCSIMLYVMTERWPLARKYRDVFERIKESVMDIIAQGKHHTRQHIPRSVMQWGAGLEEGLLGPASYQELEQMIEGMVGDSEDIGTTRGFEFQEMSTGNNWPSIDLAEPSSNEGYINSFGSGG